MVLAGGSPIDWAKITTASQLRAIPPRNSYVASVVDSQVLAKGHRALLCYGMTGLFHGTGMTGAIEQRTSQRIYVIADLVPPAADPGSLAVKLSRYPRTTIIPTASTWLGSVDAGMFVAEAQASRPSTPATTPTPATGQPPHGTAGAGPRPQRGAAGLPHRRRPVLRPARRPDGDLARPRHLLRPRLLGRTAAPQRPQRQCHQPRQTTARAPGHLPADHASAIPATRHDPAGIPMTWHPPARQPRQCPPG
jgi:hypothetical protein